MESEKAEAEYAQLTKREMDDALHGKEKLGLDCSDGRNEFFAKLAAAGNWTKPETLAFHSGGLRTLKGPCDPISQNSFSETAQKPFAKREFPLHHAEISPARGGHGTDRPTTTATMPSTRMVSWAGNRRRPPWLRKIAVMPTKLRPDKGADWFAGINTAA
jgi:hypothetical protein